MVKLIFGAGYLGKRVADRWKSAGHEVYVITRSTERAAELRREGLLPIVADVTQPASLAGLPHAETVLYAVGFDRASGNTIGQVYAGGLQTALSAISPAPHRVIYISSTGVYGQTGGTSVDENSPCLPEREGGKASLAAEEVLRRHQLGSRGIVLRLAGIYGPGRIPRKDDLLAGRGIDAPGEGHLNLIHVEDAADIVLRADASAKPPCTYNVSDGQPITRSAYYEYLAKLLGAPAPNFVPPAAGSSAALRALGDKRIRSDRIFEDLALQLRFPSYREGLASIVAVENENQ